MAEDRRKLLVVDVAALGWSAVSHLPGWKKADTVFPAVTCTVQASFRTGKPPGEHGMVGNGLFFRNLQKVLFWEQSAALVQGRRIWEAFRARGKRVGMLFWQQSMGEEVDLVATPAPIHKHSGGMIQDCYTQPPELQERLREKVGRPFNLMNYWGPLANHRSTEWIVEATSATMEMPEFAPDLLLTYLPHLDYDLQRHGPSSAQARKALDLLLGYIDRLKETCRAQGYDWMIFGDYAMEEATGGAIFPNRCLREAGLFAARDIRGMDYTDFFTSRAFAVVDHQAAHVFCRDAESTELARKALTLLAGVEEVLDRGAQEARGVAHENSGDLVLVAKSGHWFAYPWFTDKSSAPDYASHVDIHNKPGYDPCELFFGWPPGSVSMNTTRIHGSHGNNGPAYEVAWDSSLNLPTQPKTLLDLSRAVQQWMESAG